MDERGQPKLDSPLQGRMGRQGQPRGSRALAPDRAFYFLNAAKIE